MSAPRIALAVFDFDGTLVQSNEVKAKGFDRIAARYDGGAEALRMAQAEPGLDRFALLDRFADDLGLATGTGAQLARDYGQIVDAAVVAAPECPGAEQALTDLRAAGVAVHLSSATPLASLRSIVAARNWSRHFDGVHGRPATKPETLRRLMADLSLPADRIAVIGDGPDDRDSAHAVGCRFLPVGTRLPDPMCLSDVVTALAKPGTVTP